MEKQWARCVQLSAQILTIEDCVWPDQCELIYIDISAP